ncbi:MAG: M81 family metallopeptidase, partial [Bryobacteraceae bacterium]
MKVAIGGIFTESNHLVGTMTGLSCFERTELRRADAVLTSTGGVLGGALSHLRERGATILPTIFSSAVPGGVVTLGCYEGLKADLLERLLVSLPVDGVLLLQHGGAAVEELGDLDGDLIAAVRQTVGPAVPVVVTLDCHAHVTAQMVENANALVAWETYPHRDTFTTGIRGARILMDTLEGRVRPTMVMARVPVIASGFSGSTEEGPFADLMREAKALEGRDGVISTSMFLVQPHLDLPDMGSGGLVITDNDAGKAERLATGLAERYWSRRFDLEPEIRTPREAIAEGLRIPGTVLLLETSDCVGGGAAGDGAAVLRALIEANVGQPSLVPVVDPEAAALCHQAGEGS